MSTEKMADSLVDRTIFETFVQLPADLQSLMKFSMGEVDRVKLEKLAEAWQTNNDAPRKDIYGLGFKIEDDRHIEVSVTITEKQTREVDQSVTYGYSLKFTDEGKKQMTFTPSFKDIEWTIDMETELDVFSLAVEHFRARLLFYHDEIKELRLESNIDYKMDTGIPSLKQLDTLWVLKKVDVTEIIPLIKRPLVKLCVSEWKDVKPLEHLIFEVQNVLVLKYVNLTKELFMKLSAEEVRLDVRELRKYDAAKLMQWLYGSSENERRHRYFNWDGSVFDPQQVGRVFDKNWEEFLKTDVRADQYPEEHRFATLWRFQKTTLSVKFFNQPLEEKNDCQVELQKLKIAD